MRYEFTKKKYAWLKSNILYVAISKIIDYVKGN